MALQIGTRVGPYEISGLLGVGGMGEVYRATDTNLGRQVAIKVLPASLTNDSERLARFSREAQVLAALNHPNIAAIYHVEDAGGQPAIVMELVEGETLADRIGRGPIPIDEALPIAKQITEALEAAHEQGIIHRDLKPANIKVRPDGTLKVLDFGLAKLNEPNPPNIPSASLSPTITSPALMTGVGVLLGTAAYMAPEQVNGRPADKRCDVWAFGCVVYEMLTGAAAFRGETIPEVLAAILREEPNLAALPAGTPRAVEQLIRGCLLRDRKQRVGDMAVARFALGDAVSTTIPRAEARNVRNTPRWWLVGAVVVVVLAAGVAFSTRRAGPQPEMRVDIVTPPTTDPLSFALSPDGTHIAFVASGDGPGRLWLRALNSTNAQALAGTEAATAPFWSADGRSLGFFIGGQVKRLDIDGGAVQTVISGFASRGGAWNQDGTILFTRNNASPLFRIQASGGDPLPVTKLVNQQWHATPWFLPDGRRFLFLAGGSQNSSGIYLGSLDNDRTTRLTAGDSGARYVVGNWLLYVRLGSLVAQRVDLDKNVTIGAPITIVGGVPVGPLIGTFSVSNTGVIAYRAGQANRRQLAWFDRTGQRLSDVGAADDAILMAPKISPDGQRIAIHRTVQGNSDIWLLDGSRSSRFTFDAATDGFPLWSPDGRTVVFDSNRRGQRDLYRKLANGSSPEQTLLETSQNKAANDWSPDGKFLVYLTNDPQTSRDLWVLPMDGHSQPYAFLKTPFDEWRAQFSPDGRWVAYQSNEPGRYEIYVRPFRGAQGQWQVSTGGGISPRWSRDGHELFYLAPDGKLMAARITAVDDAVQVGAPAGLFTPPMVGGGAELAAGWQYDVASDGRFLINVTTEEASTAPITLIFNWPGFSK